MDDLYNTDQGSAPFELAKLMSRVESLDSELRKMRKQSGGGKKDKKNKNPCSKTPQQSSHMRYSNHTLGRCSPNFVIL